MRLDAATIATGLLHDTVEDTFATLEQIEQAFGRDVAQLVDGVTKIAKIKYKSEEERQAENYRKMVMAMASDIRVLLVRLADRVHNMRTLRFQPPDRQKASCPGDDGDPCAARQSSWHQLDEDGA